MYKSSYESSSEYSLEDHDSLLTDCKSIFTPKYQPESTLISIARLNKNCAGIRTGHLICLTKALIF